MTCDKAPTGWYCTRDAEHDGPCAAQPAETPYPDDMQRDLATPPPDTLLEIARDIVYFAHQAGMTDDCWRHRLGALRRAVRAEYDAHRALEDRIEVLEEALRWALGEDGEFRKRQAGEGVYFWRKELRKRAALAAPSGTTI